MFAILIRGDQKKRKAITEIDATDADECKPAQCNASFVLANPAG
jgi:hypothetical protein